MNGESPVKGRKERSALPFSLFSRPFSGQKFIAHCYDEADVRGEDKAETDKDGKPEEKPNEKSEEKSDTTDKLS